MVTLGVVSTSTWAGRCSGSSGLPGCLPLQGGGHNLWGQVEVVTEVLDTLVGQVPVVMSPCKLLLLGVLGGVEVLLGNHHSLLEEVLIDGHAILLGHQHPEVLTSLVEVNQAN